MGSLMGHRAPARRQSLPRASLETGDRHSLDLGWLAWTRTESTYMYDGKATLMKQGD